LFLIFKKGINFLEVLIVFTVLSLSNSDCVEFVANDEWPHSSDLNPLDYQVLGQCWSLNQSCNRSQKTSSRVL